MKGLPTKEVVQKAFVYHVILAIKWWLAVHGQFMASIAGKVEFFHKSL